MKNYKNFISEHWGQHWGLTYKDFDQNDILSEEDAIKWIKEQNEFNTKEPFIYKGLSGGFNLDNFILTDPKKYNRTSQNSYNYYTTIMSNVSEWSEYPKRSESLICSTAYDDASGYGSTFIVIPKDGSKWGVCY